VSLRRPRVNDKRAGSGERGAAPACVLVHLATVTTMAV
jgi:hypothetical protein